MLLEALLLEELLELLAEDLLDLLLDLLALERLLLIDLLAFELERLLFCGVDFFVALLEEVEVLLLLLAEDLVFFLDGAALPELLLVDLVAFDVVEREELVFTRGLDFTPSFPRAVLVDCLSAFCGVRGLFLVTLSCVFTLSLVRVVLVVALGCLLDLLFSQWVSLRVPLWLVTGLRCTGAFPCFTRTLLVRSKTL